MSGSIFRGVLPAITTPFDEAGAVDHAFLARHASWMVDHGCAGIVGCGSLGEGATLAADEKAAVLGTLVAAVGGRVPVVAAVGAAATREATALAERAAEAGCAGLMLLPPYVHRGPWREVEAHFAAVLAATPLPCMLYNNPAAYGIDALPAQLAALAAAHPNLAAVKDSGGDHRRLTAVRMLVGERLDLCAGLDDMPVEAVACGAVGWVAGLVNALPAASVRLFDLARAGRWDEAWRLYRWFLPLLRLDTVPELVQAIKAVQAEVGMGSERVRAPRLPLPAAERERIAAMVREALATLPEVGR